MESVPIIDMRDTPHASTKLRAAALIGVGSFVLDCLFVGGCTGGVALQDDYGFPSCPGARLAVDEFCSSERVPLCLPTGQAVVVKGVE